MDKSVGGWVRNLKWLSQYWITRRTVDCWIQLCQIAFNYMIWTGWCTILPTMRLLWLLVNNLVNQWIDVGAVASYSDKWVQRVRTKNARMHIIATTNQPTKHAKTCEQALTLNYSYSAVGHLVGSRPPNVHYIRCYFILYILISLGLDMGCDLIDSNGMEWNGIEQNGSSREKR